MSVFKPEGATINESVKAHIFAYNFIPKGFPNGLIDKINLKDARYYKFTSKGNSYLSNKKLSEEATYVVSRK